MTSSTNFLHGGFPLEEMRIQEASTDGIGPADVALATAAVARIAMRIHCASQLIADDCIIAGPLIDDKLIRSEACVKACLVILVDLIVAIAAGRSGVGIGGIPYHVLVGGLPVGILGVATVAFVARDLAMVLIIDDIAVNEELLVRGQRLHSSASPLPFYFRGRDRRAGFSDFPGYLNELFAAGMALKALGILICLARERRSWDKEKRKNKDQGNGS